MAAEAVRAGITHDSSSRPRGSAYWFDILFGRLAPALFFSVFIVDKLLVFRSAAGTLARQHSQASDYLAPVTQGLALAYFALLVGLFVTRLPKRAGDARPAMILVAFFGTFSVLAAAMLPGVPSRGWLQLPCAILVAVGLTYTLWGVLYLRRSFSIMPEARRLVTGGPYGLSRHPLYLGEAVAALGITLPTIGWQGALLLAFFGIAQYLRIRAEERVLNRQFPEYAEYRRHVPRYLPDPRRILKSA